MPPPSPRRPKPASTPLSECHRDHRRRRIGGGARRPTPAGDDGPAAPGSRSARTPRVPPRAACDRGPRPALGGGTGHGRSHRRARGSGRSSPYAPTPAAARTGHRLPRSAVRSPNPRLGNARDRPGRGSVRAHGPADAGPADVPVRGVAGRMGDPTRHERPVRRRRPPGHRCTASARTVIVAPVVEELYFRGYLLPRMPQRLRRWRAPTHVVLFAAYHLWSPWLIPTRVLAILPLAYIAVRTRDVRLGVVTHVVLNATDLVAILLYLQAAPLNGRG